MMERDLFTHGPDEGPDAGTREARLLLSFIGGTMESAGRAANELGAEETLLRASREELIGAGFTPGEVRRLIGCRERGDHRRHEQDLHSIGGTTLVFGEEGFPGSLLGIQDAPAALYVRGALPPSGRPAVAIIGSRRCTPEGGRLAARLARELSRGGLAVVSGLARGIDSAALRGGLEGASPAVGVLGSGLDTIYPPENGRLFLDVAAAGALVSEFPLGVGPRKRHFPRRNRLISGLVRGVLVVEAARRSGTLITVDHALSQDRVVMAVPGDVSRSAFRGTNRLIRDGASVVLSAEDVFLSLNVHPEKTPESPDPPAGQAALRGGEPAVLEACRNRALTADAIAGGTGLAAGEVLEALARLETEGLVTRHPGARFLASDREEVRGRVRERGRGRR